MSMHLTEANSATSDGFCSPCEYFIPQMPIHLTPVQGPHIRCLVTIRTVPHWQICGELEL